MLTPLVKGPRSSTLLCALLVVGCGKTSKDKAAPADDPKVTEQVASDPACAAKAEDLEAWLTQLASETSSHEVNFGWTPQVLDRAPEKVTQEADYALITPKMLSAWDHTEANHVDDHIGVEADAKKMTERLAKTFEMKGSENGDDVLRIDVDAAAPWRQVAGLVDAAAQVGYTKVVFAFEATSKAPPPSGVPEKIDDAKIMDEARDRLDELRKLCPGIGFGDAEATASAIARCNCQVDPEEVRALSWKRAKWHQAKTRVGVAVAIAKDAATAIELPAATPWSVAHAKVLDASGPVKLTAN